LLRIQQNKISKLHIPIPCYRDGTYNFNLILDNCGNEKTYSVVVTICGGIGSFDIEHTCEPLPDGDNRLNYDLGIFSSRLEDISNNIVIKFKIIIF
jgi:hypothetical protein